MHTGIFFFVAYASWLLAELRSFKARNDEFKRLGFDGKATDRIGNCSCDAKAHSGCERNVLKNMFMRTHTLSDHIDRYASANGMRGCRLSSPSSTGTQSALHTDKQTQKTARTQRTAHKIQYYLSNHSNCILQRLVVSSSTSIASIACDAHRPTHYTHTLYMKYAPRAYV